MHTRRERRFAWLTAGLSVLVTLLCGEIMVRLFLPYNTPDTLRRYSLQYLPSIFSIQRLKPVGQIVEADGSKGCGIKAADKEPDHRYFINEAGYRGRSFAPIKPGGMTRIVVLGGSSVFDVYAKDQSAEESRDWPHLVEHLLRNMGYRNVEVINAGVPGHATFDSLGRLYSQLWIYRPDYVLLYSSWNDVKYFRKITPVKPLITHFRPYDDTANPFTNYRGLWDRLLCNSQLYVKFRNQYYGRKLPAGEEGAIPMGDYQDTYGRDAIKQYRLVVQLIVDACRNIGATPVLLTEATLLKRDNSEDERKVIAYHYHRLTHRALVDAMEETYEVMRSVGREKEVAVLDLARRLNGRRELFRDGVHLTEKGSDEIARNVAGFLASCLDADPRRQLR